MLIRTILKKAFADQKLYQFPLTHWDPHLLPENTTFPKTASATADQIFTNWKTMYNLRRMEIKVEDLYLNRDIRGFCHLYNGQEAVVTGMESALTFKDMVITAYRDHANAHLRGISVYQIMCEQLGHRDGSSKAKGGSMHFYSKENNFYGGNGIVGAQVPVGVGLAFSLKYQKNKENVAVAIYGDGAANQGQIYEAANMAALWKLPVILVCEMNFYAMGTSVERHSSGGIDFHKKIHNVPGIKVNGQCSFEMREAFAFAKEYALNNGPIIINVVTYRYQGHSMSDPGTTYRIKEMHDAWKNERDPVKNLRTFLIENQIKTEEEIVLEEKNIKKFIEAETERALASPIAPMEFLTQDVYDPSVKCYIRAPNYEDSIFINENLIN